MIPQVELWSSRPHTRFAVAEVFIAFGERLTRRTFLLSYVGLLGVLTMLFAVPGREECTRALRGSVPSRGQPSEPVLRQRPTCFESLKDLGSRRATNGAREINTHYVPPLACIYCAAQSARICKLLSS